MSQYRCIICGGEIQPLPGSNVAVCPNCETRQEIKGYDPTPQQQQNTQSADMQSKQTTSTLQSETSDKPKKKRRKKIAIGVTVVICMVIAFAVVLNTVVIPNKKYNDAMALMSEGKYEEAIKAFEGMKGYKDSEEKKELAYNKYIYEKLPTAEIGECVMFGSYEQDGDSLNGQEVIEWLVLDKEDDRILVISKYALNSKCYNEEWEEITWENCTLRYWLNSDFLNTAFTQTERELIPSVIVSADRNPYNSDSGNDTTDKVFLLSVNEVNKYFASDDAKKCEPTKYAVDNGAWEDEAGNCWWWLRSPGYDQRYAARVLDDGSVYGDLDGVDFENITVRPAMWIDLNS